MPNASGRQVLMAVLERVLSDQWTEAMATAWSQLWQVGFVFEWIKTLESFVWC